MGVARRCILLMAVFGVCVAHAATRTWLSSMGGLWTSTANWSDNTLPGEGDTADLSAATGTIDLTASVIVGEILYNPAFSGTTNTLTILSDTAAPSSRSIALTTSAPSHVQVGDCAQLLMDADLKPTVNMLKDGRGSLVIKRSMIPPVRIEVYVEQGRLINAGTITFPGMRLFLGSLSVDAGAAPEFVMSEGSSYATSAGGNADFITGCTRAFTGNSRSVVTHEGGLFDLTGSLVTELFLNGFWTGGSCVYNLSGGELNLSNKRMNISYFGAGTINQTGGKVRVKEIYFTPFESGAGSGTYTFTGGELWLGGVARNGYGTAAFNIGGGCIYPFNTGFEIWGNTHPTLTGINGPTRFCSTDSSCINWLGDLSGPGGLIKEGPDTINFAGTQTFSGPIVVSNGTLNVSAAMTGGNAVRVAGGTMNLAAGYQAKFSSLAVEGGVFQVAAGSVLLLTGSDPRVSVSGTGAMKFLAGAGLPGLTVLDVSGAGAIDLSAGGQASVYRLIYGGAEQAPGLYTSANCAAITGTGTLVVGGSAWTGAGGNLLWSTGANWISGEVPNGTLTVANLSGAVSVGAPVATLVMDIGAVALNGVRFASGVPGAVLTNTCPAGVTNTLSISAESVVYVGEGETLVLDHDLCLQGTIYKRGLGTLVLLRKTYGVTPGTSIYLCVEGGRVIGCGPVTDVLPIIGKPDRAAAGAAPEFILENAPEASVGGSSFISVMSCLGTSLSPGNGVFTQNGGTVTPACSWAEGMIIGLAAGGAALGGTGTYNLVNGTLQMSKPLHLANGNGSGVFIQSGGLADLALFVNNAGEVRLSGGLLTLDTFDNTAANICTFYMGGGRLEPKTATTLTLESPAVFTGVNGDMTFAPAAGRAITLSGALSGSGGFIKDDAGLLTLSGVSAFSGVATVRNGTLAVSGSLAGTNDVVLLGGTFDVTASGGTKLGDLAVTNGTVSLASGVVATAERFFIEGTEWAAGMYASTNCAKITGDGLLIVGAEPGQWTNRGDNDNWNTAGNWVAGIIPNGLYAVANLSAAVSNEAPVRTLVMDIGAVTNKQLIFNSGVAGAVLTNTCPAGVTNTLYLAAGAIIEVGEGQTLVLDHDLCLMGSVYKRGLGTLILRRSTYTLPSLVTSTSTIYTFVDGGKVIDEGPMNNVLVSVGKPSSTEAGPTPEFILADTPQASIGGTSLIAALNVQATSPGPGVFTQNGGTVVPAIAWGDKVILAYTANYVGTPGTGTYNLVNGNLTVPGRLRFGVNGDDSDGHYGIFNQSGGTADVSTLGGSWGELNLTGGTLKLGTSTVLEGGGVTFSMGGGRLEPKSTDWVVLRAPTAFTGVNGDMTFAPAAGQSIQLTGRATTSGSGGFVKEGEGMLWLSNVNTFTGAARIDAGTCTIAPTCMFTETTNLAVNAGAMLDVQRAGQTFNSNFCSRSLRTARCISILRVRWRSAIWCSTGPSAPGAGGGTGHRPAPRRWIALRMIFLPVPAC